MMEPHTIKALLFDFDGTLLDSFSAHYQAYETMFTRLGIQVSREEFLRIYTPDWYQVYRAVGLPEKKWELADEIWLEAAAGHESKLFPGVEETLRGLGERYRLGLVTSGSRDRVCKDLARVNIGSLFEVMVTADDIRQPKPAPEGLHIALNHLGLRAGEAVYVGDTEADFLMAQAAGMAFVWVTSPFSGQAAEGASLVDSVNELVVSPWLEQ